MVEGLLGRPAIEKLQLVTVAQVGEAHSRPQEAFPELFRGLGRLEGAHHIKLKDGATPQHLPHHTELHSHSWRQ